MVGGNRLPADPPLAGYGTVQVEAPGLDARLKAGHIQAGQGHGLGKQQQVR